MGFQTKEMVLMEGGSVSCCCPLIEARQAPLPSGGAASKLITGCGTGGGFIPGLIVVILKSVILRGSLLPLNATLITHSPGVKRKV
jgi:hypothetical protein